MKKSEGGRSSAEKKSEPVKGTPPNSAASPVAVEAVTLGVRIRRGFLLMAGVVLTHFVLFAPSLLGFKILLPLDCLALPGAYLPRTPEYAHIKAGNIALSDQVFQFEFQRRFATTELRAGRFPLWDPYHYCGAPFVVPFLSPFNIPYYLLPTYVTLAWTHVLVAAFAASGAYLFFRRVLGVGFWPAAVAAWCFPLTGFFQLWLGFYLSYTAAFLPWLLVAVDSTIRKPLGWGGPALAVVTGLLLISGAFDLAGQALLAAGFFAVWRLGEIYLRSQNPIQLAGPAAALTVAWVLGFLLAAPYWMPLTEYTKTGLRTQRRAAGIDEERPPLGPAAAAQMVLPYIYGSTSPGWAWLSPAGNLQESAAQAYSGLFAVLVVAPLGLACRRLFSLNLFMLFLIFVASAWVLNVPILTAILRLPGLNLMSHNRFLFVTSFAFLSLTAAGLDAIFDGRVTWHKAFIVPVVVLGLLCAWCAMQASDINSAVTAEKARNDGDGMTRGDNPQGIANARNNMLIYFIEAMVSCAAAMLLWLVIFRAPHRLVGIALGLVLVADLLWFARNQNPQCDPALLYPELPALSQLAKAPPGRIAGVGCLPPLLAQGYGLSDVRGYDAVDPARISTLLIKVKDPNSPAGTPGFDYATVQYWYPHMGLMNQNGDFKILPILNSLNLRYIVGRGKPSPRPRKEPLLFEGDDYWVYENPDALPRVYVPERVEVLKEAKTLTRLTDPRSAVQFNPRALAYVETDPDLHENTRGTAEIVSETPREIHISADMESPGLLVLADQWYAGWNAYLNGNSLPVLLVNAAVRGVKLPAGHSDVVFRYEPTGWSRGLSTFVVAIFLLAAWSAVVTWRLRRNPIAAITI
jgi:hypothetical protein